MNGDDIDWCDEDGVAFEGEVHESARPAAQSPAAPPPRPEVIELAEVLQSVKPRGARLGRVGAEAGLDSGSLMERVHAAWAGVSASTEPLDRGAVTAAVGALYEAASLARPAELIWTRGPREGLTAAQQLAKRAKGARAAVWKRAHVEASTVLDREVEEVVRQRVARALEDSFGQACRQHLRAELKELDAGPLDAAWGQHEAGACATYDLFARAGIAMPLAEALARVSRLTGWWWPFEGACVLAERPVRVERDARGRLHAEDRMALEYADGSGFYAYQGVRVTPEFLFAPHTMDPRAILGEKNMEVRRVMMERYGLKRLMENTGAEVLDEDRHRTLYRLQLRGDEPIVAVRVVCPSTGHVYLLRVPPTIRTCREAVAWTFGMDESLYRPLAES